ncbi:Probable LRR receptor-like serine/threonine-protein kinase At5g37450 [Geodia barretti]|uniref:Probable LRR receptor-like serine/threonine-protein kinase At5g37450 n=1 Tax=Geodia barretti TaxID=519541 RepID=A0AA35RWR5_GEOBA|nr:Probable LRR receptor-like serine/threonine-protein kinase At5g37450 [Geodia barretti]
MSRHQLTGEIPPELGGLSNLTRLCFQPVDGDDTKGVVGEPGATLTHLRLHRNQLTGEIPPELGGLSNLEWLYLGGNLLTGCVPAGLRDVPNNDIVSLGLPFCSEHPCVSGGAVPDATNTGLISDCEALLAARDTLAGTAALNWSADTPIADWTGVALGEASGRVTELDLGALGLNGRIPKELGSLANLQGLYLRPTS